MDGLLYKDAKIFVAGARGLVGSAIIRRLRSDGYSNIIAPTSDQLDLTDQNAVISFFTSERPEYVFFAAGRVGGIHANSTYTAQFAYENMMMQCNVIHWAHQCGVKKLLFLGSSCIYPREANVPIKESALLTGRLEETNKSYAVAKIAGIQMCEAYRRQYGCNFITAMPTNLYGPNDRYDLENSHVLPALIRKIHDAKESMADEVVLWGSGAPMREFLHVDDLVSACLLLMDRYNEAGHVNVGSGEEVSIRKLAETIADIAGYDGQITWDSSRPDGTMRKAIDSTKMRSLGWVPEIKLAEGIKQTYETWKNTRKQR